MPVPGWPGAEPGSGQWLKGCSWARHQSRPGSQGHLNREHHRDKHDCTQSFSTGRPAAGGNPSTNRYLAPLRSRPRAGSSGAASTGLKQHPAETAKPKTVVTMARPGLVWCLCIAQPPAFTPGMKRRSCWAPASIRFQYRFGRILRFTNHMLQRSLVGSSGKEGTASAL